MGVPVYLTASASGGSGTLNCSVSQLIPGGQGAIAGVNADNTGYYTNTSANTSGSVSLPMAVLLLQPNHVYWANFVCGFNNATLAVVAPQGFTVVMNNIAQENYTFPVSNHTTSIGIPFAIIPSSDFTGNAGVCTELSTGQIHWEVALGWQMNGKSAGTLALSDLGTEGSWNSANVQTLFLSQTTQETTSNFGVIFSVATSGTGYIRTNQALVRLTNVGGFKVEFFPWSQVTGSMWNYTISGTAYMTYLVSVPTSTSLQVKRTDGAGNAYTTVLTRSGVGVPYSWTLDRWATTLNSPENTPFVVETRTTTGSLPSYSETRTIAYSGGANATTVTNVYASYPWGEMLVSCEQGSSAPTGASSVTYETVPGSGEGMVQNVTNLDGSWAYYSYGSQNSEVCALPATTLVPYNGSSQGSGLLTTNSYVNDEFGIPTEPSSVVVTDNQSSTTISTTNSSYSYGSATNTSVNGLFINTTTQSAYAGTSSGSPLTSTTKTYSEIIPSSQSTFLVGQIHSATNPDGTKTCFVYQYGSMSGSQFEPANEGALPLTGSCVVAIHGTAANAGGGTLLPTLFNYPNSNTGVNYTIDPVYVYDGGAYTGSVATPSSTLEATIRDGNGLVIRTELYAWHNSAWMLVSATSLSNDVYGHVVNRTTNNLVYAASYSGILLESETNENGLTTSYTSFDPAGRVLVSSKPTPSGANLVTNYTYDADSRTTKFAVGSTAGSEQLVTSRAYDDAGRLVSDAEPGQGATTYAYNVSGRTRSTNHPDGGVETDSYQNDGSLLSTSGSAVVPSYYTYSNPDSSGNITMTVYSGSSTGPTPRYYQTVRDGYGRSTSKSRPGFTGQPVYSEGVVFDPVTGRLDSNSRTGLASTVYQYDSLGQVNFNGLGTLSTSGSQRLAGTNHFLEYLNSAWWDHLETIVFPTNGSSSFVTAKTTRTRLSGFGSGQVFDQLTTDMYGASNQTEVSAVLSGSTRTTTTTFPGLTTSQTEVAVDGLRTSTKGTDGLTTNYSYDGWNRIYWVQDPQGNKTTLGYFTGTNLVKTEQNQAGQVTTFGYDSMARRNLVQDTLGNSQNISYDTMGRVTGISGPGTNPVSYYYEPTYGDRQTMSTTRNAGGAWDTTTWTYDAPSGLVASKEDALGGLVKYSYNSYGKVFQRTWARNVVTTYSYDDGNTGELTGIAYNDGKTASVGYSYYRFGGLYQVTDSTGTRTFNNDPTYPTRIDNELLGSTFYGGRMVTTQYGTSTGSGGAFGNYTMSTTLGRPSGMGLGVSGNPTRDLQQNLVYSSLGQLVGVQVQAGSEAQRSFTYSYGGQNAGNGGYAGLPSGYTASGGSLSVTYGYEGSRHQLTSINSQWTSFASPTLTRFDYSDNLLGQRSSAMMSGSAFGDYFPSGGYSHVYRSMGYDATGQLQSSVLYRGDTVNPNPGDQLPAQTFQYTYDSAGNRASDGETGSINTGDNSYTTNALNQYSAKENNVVRVLGTSSAAAVVSTSPATTVGQVDRIFGASLVPANTSGPQAGTVAVTGTVYGATTNKLSPVSTQSFFIGASLQSMQYDADGNLTNDGMWDYTYDGENRLVSMANIVSGSNGLLDTIYFTYDYLGRRVEKQVTNAQGTLDHRYVYYGNALIAEIATSTGLLTRTYFWGIGQAAPLLQLTNFVSGSPTQDYLPTFDGNRNLVSLVNASTGAIAAIYEYGPFGELLRSQQPDSTVADNPIRFSSQFTDIETGLVYYGQRFYSPTLGRFINRDPIQEAGGINLYGFCGNDPVGRFDPTGNSWFSKWWDRTFLSFFQHVRQNWDDGGRTDVELVVVVVVSIYLGEEVGGLIYTPAGSAAVDSGAADLEIAAGVPATVTVPTAASGALASSVASGAITATEASTIAGVAGGAAAGFVSGAGMSAVEGGTFSQDLSAGLRGAASGGIMGGVAGYFGNAWNLSRVLATAAAGGVSSEVGEGSFKRGFEINGLIALLTDVAYNMRAAEVLDSRTDQFNANGISAGFFGDAFKLGGGRFDLNTYYETGDVFTAMVSQPFGGFQGGAGTLFGIPYSPGGFVDNVVEAFAGPHDWLGSWWSYDGNGDNYYQGSLFGRFLSNYISKQAASMMDQVMGGIDIPLAAPFAAASEISSSPGSTAIFNGGHH